MKIDGYAVSMNMDYFSYRGLNVQTSMSRGSAENFSNDEALKTSAIQNMPFQTQKDENGIIKELSASLLKSINERTRSRDIFNLSATYIEAEALNFSTTAYVKAGDKEIAFELNVSLSRSFVQQTNISINDAKALQDPLILNLDGSFPSLSSKTFSFDIDSDGKEDQISMLGSGSAFLALDKNSNGIIDDGSELFGAKSGNGFAELRAYDDDKNGWIDENDKIFNKLRIWKKSDGKDELVALGQVGIGAIFLGDIATPFELKTLSNETMGVMRKSGFFLFENGKAGVMSQIDLAVGKETQESQALTELKDNMKRANAFSSYKTEPQEESDSIDDRMQKLRKLLKSLESKLARADGNGEKVSLQAQIGAVFAQMMSLLSKSSI